MAQEIADEPSVLIQDSESSAESTTLFLSHGARFQIWLNRENDHLALHTKREKMEKQT